MPCNDGGPFYPADRMSARNDQLARENDMLRETLIALYNAKPGTAVEISEEVMSIINKNQVEHRKQDLKRLEKFFRARLKLGFPESEKEKYFAALGKVMVADPKKPLEPQLGFSPDEY